MNQFTRASCLLGAAVGFLNVSVANAATAFNDSFSGTTLSANFSQIQVAGSGPGGGTAGSSTGVNNGLTLSTGATANGKRWVRAAASDYTYLNQTLTLSASLSGITNAGTSNSGFEFFLIGDSAVAGDLTNDTPFYKAPNALEFRFDDPGTGANDSRFRLLGKTGTANASPTQLAQFSSALPNSGTLSISITNSDAAASSTVTAYLNGTQLGASYTLPAAYNTSFDGGAVYLYLMSITTGSNAAGNDTSLSAFSVASSVPEPASLAALLLPAAALLRRRRTS